jgi:hypothetical protein
MDAGLVSSTNPQRPDQSTAGTAINYPVDNPLNQYANYTYNVSLVLVADGDAYAAFTAGGGDALNIFDQLSKRYVAATAQFGTTDGNDTSASSQQLYNMPMVITELSIDAIVSANERTRNSQSYQWTMQISEPYGLSLPDKIYAISQDLKIKNWLQTPFFLDIYFTGYDSDGTMVKTKLFRKIHRVNITDMSATTTVAGSVYSISGIFDSMFAQSNFASITGQNQTVVARTFVEFLGKLQDYLNKQQQTKEPGKAQTLEYEFRISKDSKFNSYTLADPAKDKGANPERTDMKTQGITGSGTTITFGSGQSINSVIEQVLSRSPEAQKALMGDDKNKGAAHGIVTHAMVQTTAEITGYDEATHKYNWKVIYIIKEFDKASNVVRGETELQENLSNKNKIADKIVYLVQQQRLVKQYNYIYTGRNTEVINFDIQLTNFWASMQQKFWPFNASSSTQGATTAKDGAAQQVIENPELTKLNQQISQLKAKAEELQSDLNTANKNKFAIQVAEQTNTRLTGQESVPTTLPNTDAIQSELNSTAAKLAAAQAKASGLPQTTPAPSQSSRTNREDQINGVNKTTTQSNILPVSVASRPELPTKSMSITPQQDTVDNRADGPGNNSTTAYNQIMRNIYDGVNFVTIELEIRGDPYWLGDSNIDQAEVFRTNYQPVGQPSPSAAQTAQAQTGVANQTAAAAVPQPAQNTSTTSLFADYNVGDISFELNFRTGQIPNENTGLMDLSVTNKLGDIGNSDANSSRVFQGVYAVNEVIHMFKDGKFTQKLKALKWVTDLNLSVAAAQKTAAANSKQPSQNVAASNGASSPIQVEQMAIPSNGITPAVPASTYTIPGRVDPPMMTISPTDASAAAVPTEPELPLFSTLLKNFR